MKLGDFDEIVAIDFEFLAEPGERPRPFCFVAKELRSGRVFRHWVDDGRCSEPPFACGRAAIVAFFASAELGCYRALNWPYPYAVLDLFSEFRLLTNGLALPGGSGLLSALRWFGIPSLEESKKAHMRKLILSGGPFDAGAREQILTYCESDVDGLVALLPCLIRWDANIDATLFRGEYMKAVADAEYAGIPVDAQLYRAMVERWPELQANAIRRVNEKIPVFEGRSFRMKLFAEWLTKEGLISVWPLTTDGGLSVSEDTFREQSVLHPQVELLRQTRQLLSQLHRPGLTIGRDSRNRCLLSPFATKTGRNAPSTTKFIFGAPSFLRGLIRPELGRALAALDWSQQEFALAARLANDVVMQQAYLSGDPYLSFAKYVGAIPPNGTKESHPHIRDQFKTVVLATQYQMGAHGLAYRLGVTLNEALDLLEHHQRTFAAFWRWSDAVVDHAQLRGELESVFGWRMQLISTTTARSIRNYPMQSAAAGMLQLAMVYAARAGVSVIAPIHDAILIEANEADIEQAADCAAACMRRASEAVLPGFPLRTDVQIIRYPGRYKEKRGQETWQWMMELLQTHEVAA